jgi:hypothetical protein
MSSFACRMPTYGPCLPQPNTIRRATMPSGIVSVPIEPPIAARMFGKNKANHRGASPLRARKLFRWWTSRASCANAAAHRRAGKWRFLAQSVDGNPCFQVRRSTERQMIEHCSRSKLHPRMSAL